MKTFRHSGKIGDIIYSLPTIRALGGGVVYVPQDTPDGCKGMHDNVFRLLMAQPFIKEVRDCSSGLPYMHRAPGIHIDYDLDMARLQPAKGVIHIVKRYMDAFGIKDPQWKQPWLHINTQSPIKCEYSIINYTGRHIKNDQTGAVSKVDWKRAVEGIKGTAFFVGTVDEHHWFYHNVCPIEYYQTCDLLDLAIVVNGAKAVYCNQSCVLALSQALGKDRYLDIKPGKTNCILGLANEIIL